MNLSPIARIRTAIDILRNRMPGALAMFKAEDIAISVHHNGARDTHSCQVVFFFDHDAQACGNAYRAIERIYEMNRVQCDLAGRPIGAR